MSYTLRCVSAGLAVVGSLLIVPRPSFAQTQERVRRLVGRYLLAAQKHDYPSLARLTGEFKLQEFQIKEENPQSLWQSLLAEHWKQKTEDLERKQVGADSLPGTDLPWFHSEDDRVIYETRQLLALLTPGTTWSVAEIRPRPRRPLSAVYYLDVYVAVSYASIDSAPRINGKALKKTILSCTLAGPMLDSVNGCDRFEKGDVFWVERQ